MIGTQLSHYRITAKLGEGGMGEVYLAEDISLRRKVALKFLPAYLANDETARLRFVREARSAAAIDHPYICKIHETGEVENKHFIVMEYVQGLTLKDRLKKGRIPVNQGLQIASEVAEALEEAHSKGFIHRDLKPSNLMLTPSGHAKVMDFGLAKKIAKGEGTEQDLTLALTREGITLGTLAYMSPEQLRGETVDARSDVFSFGVVLYEMLTGVHPFRKATAVETTQSILAEAPPLLVRYTQEASELLQHTFQKMLAKDREQRYQSIHEVRTNLRKQLQKASVTSSAEEASIVVLPFDNLSPDPDQDYFADGLTEEIIFDLAKVRALRVISRTSAMTFKGRKKKVRDIADELGVQYVLEGSVRKAGNNLRITAQLIEAVSDAHIWADKYSGTLDDIFDIQEKVSRSIVDALELTLSPEEDHQIAERPIDDIRAYECYLRARGEMLKGTKAGLEGALRNLEVGLEIVGENVLFYTGMAEVYLYYYEFGFKADEESLQNAEKFAKKVTELEPNSADSHYLMGRIERLRGTVLKAARHFERAFAADPNHTNNLLFLGHTYSLQVGKPILAEPLFKRLGGLDPLMPLSILCLGLFHWMKGQLDQTLSTFQKILRLEPENAFTRLFTVYVLAWQEKFDEACRLLEQAIQRESHDYIVEWCVFLRCALQGDKNKALETLSEDAKRYFWNDPEFTWLGACAYTLLDEKEEALDWLEHAIDRGWINHPLFAGDDPLLKNIRSEVRFKKLMERIKPEWERFEVGIDLSTLPLGEMT